MTVRSEITTITPHQAAQLLEKNAQNRMPRAAAVAKYARDMLAGRWTVNGESVKVDRNGNLLDGQHRLLACVQSNVAFRTVLITGLEPEAFADIDTGAKRTLANVLKRSGEANASILASAIATGARWDSQGSPLSNGSIQLSISESLEWLKANGDVRDAVHAWSTLRVRTAPFRTPPGTTIPFLMRIRRLSIADASAFMEALKTGANLDENDPISRLRLWLSNAQMTRGRVDRVEYAAVMIKTWNYWIQGREIKVLRWTSGGVNREAFPVLLGLDGRTYDEIMADSTHNPANLQQEAAPTRRNLSEFGATVPADITQAQAV